MTEKLLKEFKDSLRSVKLAPGPSGAFEVSINGKLAYSKLQMGRFPAYHELRDPVQAAI